jgi:aspartate/methionine/tyrosine aminotransferase
VDASSTLFSERSVCFGEENVISAKKRALLADGRTLLDLTKSNPTRVGLPHFEALPEILAEPGVKDYAPLPFGLLSARQALAMRWTHLGYRVPPERIVLSASTSEAYGFLFKLLCNPGDEVLIPQPSYPLFEHLARLEHVKLVPYDCVYDGAWYLDLDSVRAARTARTKAILLVSPNNPTGSIVSPEELTALGQYGIPLVCDEVFSGFLFGAAKARFRSAVTLDDTLVFVLDGLSKSMGLPQCKLGWLSVNGPRNLVDEALNRLELICDSYLSVGTAIQLALPTLLSHERGRREVIQSRLESNLELLRRLTFDQSVTLLSVDGGWSAVLQVPKTQSETDWVLGLLEQTGVVVQPGWFFDFTREAYLIVSLLTEPIVFENGILKLCEYVAL